MNLTKPMVIYEIANNHMGDLSHFKKILEQFYELSLPFKSINFAIKFQYRDLETFIHDKAKNSTNPFVKRFEETQLLKSDWNQIIKISKKKFITICTPFDEISVDKVIKEKFDYLKIASCSMNDWGLLEYIAKRYRGKIICSLGGANETEIARCVNFLLNKKNNVSFLYCVAKYPSSYSEQNFEYFVHLKKIYGNCIAGFSSHETRDSELSGAIAYGAGARIFEKHIGVKNKKYKINDYSWDSIAISKWLKNLEYAIKFFGTIKNRDKNLYVEKNNLIGLKRGIFLKRDIIKKKNEKILKQNIFYKFPCENNQLSSFEFSKFNTYTATSKIYGNNPILKKNILILKNNQKLENIRNKIKNMISESGVYVNPKSTIEISHHYGIENFKKNGISMITIYNKKYCKKLIFLIEKQNHPEQFHKVKKETFNIIYGKIFIKINGKRKILDQGEIITILPGQRHEFGSVLKKGAIIEELSSESVKSDSYYTDKKIIKNKKRKSYISLNYNFFS